MIKKIIETWNANKDSDVKYAIRLACALLTVVAKYGEYGVRSSPDVRSITNWLVDKLDNLDFGQMVRVALVLTSVSQSAAIVNRVKAILTKTIVPTVMKNFDYYKKSDLFQILCSSRLPEVEPIVDAHKKYIVEHVAGDSLESIQKALDVLQQINLNKDFRSQRRSPTEEILSVLAKFRTLIDKRLADSKSDSATIYKKMIIPIMKKCGVRDVSTVQWFIALSAKMVDKNIELPRVDGQFYMCSEWLSARNSFCDDQTIINSVRLSMWNLAEKMRKQDSYYWEEIWNFWRLNLDTIRAVIGQQFTQAFKEFVDQVNRKLSTGNPFDKEFSHFVLTSILETSLDTTPSSLNIFSKLTFDEKNAVLTIFDALFPYLELSPEDNIRSNKIGDIQVRLYKFAFELLAQKEPEGPDRSPFLKNAQVSLGRTLQTLERLLKSGLVVDSEDTFKALCTLMALGRESKTGKLAKALIASEQKGHARVKWHKK
jgi:hypothetical protein